MWWTYLSRSDVVISVRTLAVAVAVTASMGVSGSNPRNIPSCRYCWRKSWPHVLTQWASSMATSTIWSVEYNLCRNAKSKYSIQRHHTSATTYIARSRRNKTREWCTLNCISHSVSHRRLLYSTGHYQEGSPVCSKPRNTLSAFTHCLHALLPSLIALGPASVKLEAKSR